MKEKRDKTSGKENGQKVNESLTEYQFIKETIKKRPWNRRAAIRRIAAITGTGILFGVSAAVAFSLIMPAAVQTVRQKQGAEPVTITPDSQEDAVEAIPTEVPEPVSSENQEKSALQQYEDIYQEVLSTAEEPKKALVTVAGETGEADLLDNTYLTNGKTSGIIFAKNSVEFYILTSSSVSEHAQKIRVVMSDGTVVEGKTEQSDPRTGIAIVSVSLKELDSQQKRELTVARLGNSYSLIQGKLVIAIGSPSGYANSVAYGTITSVSNKVTVTDSEFNLLVTDIQGSVDGSGVLLDSKGEVIGVISQSYGTDNSSQTMVKALAVSQLKPLIENLSNGKAVKYLGINGQDVTEEMAESLSIPQGIYVDSVEEGSPAMEGGIQSGDIIQYMDEKKVLTMQSYSTCLQSCKEGQKVILQLKRKGAEGYTDMEFELTVKEI